MARVKVLILMAPGTNCDFETRVAFERAGAGVDAALVNALFRGEKKLADYQVLVIPGGFTYGDDIAAGKIMANEIRLRLGFIASGRVTRVTNRTLLRRQRRACVGEHGRHVRLVLLDQ